MATNKTAKRSIRDLHHKIRRPLNSGLTLIEVLTSIAILSVIVAGTLGIFVMSNQSWRVSGVQINLQQQVRVAMEKMIYGTAEVGTMRNGIIGAEQIQILDYASGNPVDAPTAGDRIDYQLSDAATRNRSFYLDSGRIWYQHGAGSATAITPDPATTGMQVSSLQFISDVNTVLIGIGLDIEQVVGGVQVGADTTVRVHLQSAFKRRN